VPAHDDTIIHLIAEALDENPGLGWNKLYGVVTPLYGEKKGLTKLSKRHFSKYLKLMIKDGLVDRLSGAGKRKKVELYLTEIGKTQYHQNRLHLPSLSEKMQKNGVPQDLKALYAIILYFNQGVNYVVHTKDALEYILREFDLSMSSLDILSHESIVKYETAKVRQVIFQSRKKDVIVYKDVYLQSDIHEPGTTRYRCFLRGITCEAILKKNRELDVFRYLSFTSEDIRNAIESLCNIDVLKPIGSLGHTIASEVIYKIDMSVFDFMFAINNEDPFARVISVMTEIWFNFRRPTYDELKWLHFVYGEREADKLINKAYEARNKITGGQGMTSYIREIKRYDKMKLNEINKSVDVINEKIAEIVSHMDSVREAYSTTINIHKDLLENIHETIFPDFFVNLHAKILRSKTRPQHIDLF
jgi:hypothetical protein